MAEHLDHLHYLNDILIINCEFLNDVLTDHLLNRLFLPLYVYSLENPDKVSLLPPACVFLGIMLPLAGATSGSKGGSSKASYPRERPFKAHWPSVLDEKVTKKCNIPGVRGKQEILELSPCAPVHPSMGTLSP